MLAVVPRREPADPVGSAPRDPGIPTPGIGWTDDRAQPSCGHCGLPAMRVPPRLLAVLLFLVLGLLALVLAGLLDWIVGVLFLTMEFVGGFIREVFRRRDRRQPPSRHRHASVSRTHAVRHRRESARFGCRPRRSRAADLASSTCPEPRLKLLVPVSGDEPDLLAFALEECRSRQAEMILLFLRPMAVTPMGPNPLPGLPEDDEARSLFDRVEREAARFGVPIRTIYEATSDRPTTIGGVARACQADVVVVGKFRGSRIDWLLARDPNPCILRMLPERASLVIRAS